MSERLSRRTLFARSGRVAWVLAVARVAAPLAQAAGEGALIRSAAVGTGGTLYAATSTGVWSATTQYALGDVARIGEEAWQVVGEAGG